MVKEKARTGIAAFTRCSLLPGQGPSGKFQLDLSRSNSILRSLVIARSPTNAELSR